MKYAEMYTKDDLFDMFANQADVEILAKQPVAEIEQQLQELAPDMEDAADVATIIRDMAGQRAYGLYLKEKFSHSAAAQRVLNA